MLLTLRELGAEGQERGGKNGDQHGCLGLHRHEKGVRYRGADEDNQVDGQPVHSAGNRPAHLPRLLPQLPGLDQDPKDTAREEVQLGETQCT